MMRRLRVLALLAGAVQSAWAQADCPHSSEVRAPHLHGLWRAEFDGRGHAATLLLEQHPVYAGSLSGTINRNGDRGKLAGDVEDGEFTLEESADGVRIAAAWLGEVVEGSCGREIRGEWRRDGETSGPRFVLRKE